MAPELKVTDYCNVRTWLHSCPRRKNMSPLGVFIIWTLNVQHWFAMCFPEWVKAHSDSKQFHIPSTISAAHKGFQQWHSLRRCIARWQIVLLCFLELYISQKVLCKDCKESSSKSFVTGPPNKDLFEFIMVFVKFSWAANLKIKEIMILLLLHFYKCNWIWNSFLFHAEFFHP